MAPKQDDLSKFLCGGRINVSGIIKLSDSLEQFCDLGQCAGAETETGASESFGDNVFVGTAKPTGSSDSDLQVLDHAVENPMMEAVKLMRQSYENIRHFQDSWATQLPWAESVLGKDGCICQGEGEPLSIRESSRRGSITSLAPANTFKTSESTLQGAAAKPYAIAGFHQSSHEIFPIYSCLCE